MKTIDKLKYLFTPLISGSLIGLIINKSIDYQMLIKPPVSPPKLAFPIAWTTIYILMGISFYLYKKKGLNKLDKLYYTQLIVNLLCSIISVLFKFRLL